MMSSGLLLARLQLRHGWRAWIGIALMIGLAGGMVLGTFAGAKRTWSAVERMIADTEAFHVLVNPDSGVESALTLADIEALPMVEQASRVEGLWTFPMEPIASLVEMDSGPGVLATDGGVLYDFNRPVLTAGRTPSLSARDEAFVNQRYADRAGIAVGDVLRWRMADEQDLESIFMSASDDEAVEVINSATFGTPVELTVVGTGHTIDSVVVDQDYDPIDIFVPPGFFEAVGAPRLAFFGIPVRLTDTRPDTVNDFMSAVDALAPGEKIVYQTLPATQRQAQRAATPSGTALAVFSAVAAALGLLFVMQAISRRLSMNADDNEIFAVLGSTRADRFGASISQVLLASATGTMLAVIAAFSLSWFMPVGPAARAETAPGFSFDVTVLVGGGLAWGVAVVIAGLYPAWRASARRARSRTIRRPWIHAPLRAVGAPPSMVAGIGFAVGDRTSRTTVATRTALVGAGTAVAVAVATMVFAASLDRVISDSAFYGSNFDVIADLSGDTALDESLASQIVQEFAAIPEVTGAAEMRITELRLNGRLLPAVAFAGGPSGVPPTIAEGRAPATPSEIALGGNTMTDLGVGLGDDAVLSSASGETVVTIVGRAVLPGVGLYSGSNHTAMGTGVLLAPDAFVGYGAGTEHAFVASLSGGMTVEEFEELTQPRVEELVGSMNYRGVARPSDVSSLAELRNLPLGLTALLMVLLGTAVTHALVSSGRGHRVDLAIMRALGAPRSFVRRVGLWHGLTVAAVAVLTGVPVGLILGRWSWRALAEAFATLAQPLVPWWVVLSLTVCVCGLGALLGATRTRRRLSAAINESLRVE